VSEHIEITTKGPGTSKFLGQDCLPILAFPLLTFLAIAQFSTHCANVAVSQSTVAHCAPQLVHTDLQPPIVLAVSTSESHITISARYG